MGACTFLLGDGSGREPQEEATPVLRGGSHSRKRRGRKRAIAMRATLLIEMRPNARWSVDFVRSVRQRPPLSLRNRRHSILGHRVSRELTTLIEDEEADFLIVSDKTTEVTFERRARLNTGELARRRAESPCR